MISDLTIKNFRGIETLQIDGFEKFNIFVGENSSGKTTILEALFIGLDALMPENIISAQNLRDIRIHPANISSLFHNFDIETPIALEMHYKQQTKIKTTIEPLYHRQYLQNEAHLFVPNTKEKAINGLKYRTLYNEEQTPEAYNLEIGKDGSVNVTPESITPSSTHLEKTHISIRIVPIFLENNIKRWALHNAINNIRINKQVDKLIKYLKLFDPRISDIETQGDIILLNLDGVSRLVNINLMGEGFKKYTGIIAFLLDFKQWQTKFCICIDEIENGLHPKGLKNLLRAIEELTHQEETEFQFFITTHSLEFLEVAREELSESKIFKVSSTLSGIKTYPYLQEGGAYFESMRIDPRGEK